MESLGLPLKLIIAFIIGAVVGLEREINERKEVVANQGPTAILGIRSFALTCVLGAIVGILYPNFIFISLALSLAFFALTIAFYVVDSLHTKDPGLTTELGLFYSFIIGLLIATEIIPIQLTLALSVVLILVLSRKESIKNIIRDIRQNEVNAFISFAIIALLVLPFLPNINYSLSDIPNLAGFLEKLGLNAGQVLNLDLVNPFKVWIIVALITGVELIGYVLERVIGKKSGWLLASAAGGFISSTATTQSLAQQSVKAGNVNHLVAAAVIANLVSFLQIAIIIGSLNLSFLVGLLPTLLPMIIGALVIAVFFVIRKESLLKVQTKAIEEKKIINLAGALKFTALYVAVSIVSRVALAMFGNSGFLITTALGAIVGLDAVMINTAQVAGSSIDFRLAVIAFILANFVNLAGKSVYSFLHGRKEFAIKFAVSMGLIIILSLTGILVRF